MPDDPIMFRPARTERRGDRPGHAGPDPAHARQLTAKQAAALAFRRVRKGGGSGRRN